VNLAEEPETLAETSGQLASITCSVNKYNKNLLVPDYPFNPILKKLPPWPLKLRFSTHDQAGGLN